MKILMISLTMMIRIKDKILNTHILIHLQKEGMLVPIVNHILIPDLPFRKVIIWQKKIMIQWHLRISQNSRHYLVSRKISIILKHMSWSEYYVLQNYQLIWKLGSYLGIKRGSIMFLNKGEASLVHYVVHQIYLSKKQQPI